jgi:dienelactone hydrolase
LPAFEVRRIIAGAEGTEMVEQMLQFPGHSITLQSFRVLPDAGATLLPNVIPGARHSFMNDQSRAFDPAASEDALARTFQFFEEHLRRKG